LGQILVSSLGVAALGDRLCFSLPVMSKSGATIYLSESKSVLRYRQKSKAKSAQMDTAMFDEAVTALSGPTMPFLGVSS
jgi:hypothetical protein